MWATVYKPEARYIGYCGVYPHFGPAGPIAGEGTLGYYLARPYWGRGLATEAARAFVTFVFDELQLRYPGQFTDGQIRTLQRHIAVWRAHTILAFDDAWSDEAVDAGQILPQPFRAEVDDDVDDAAERSA